MIVRGDNGRRRYTMAGSRLGTYRAPSLIAQAEQRRAQQTAEADKQPSTWYSIKYRNAAPEEDDEEGLASPAVAVIDIFGEIGFWGVESAAFSSDLRDVDTDTIEVRVNSPGGDIYEGLAIYNALVDHPARIDVHVDGLAASIASVIAQAGDSIQMAPNAQMMIHDAWGMTIGDAAEHLKAVEDLNRHSDNIARVYATRSGRRNAASWRELMRAETWYTAEEAVAAGLADSVKKHKKRGNAVEDPARAWSAELAGYRFAGRGAAPAPVLLDPPAPAAPAVTWGSGAADWVVTNGTSSTFTWTTTTPAEPEPEPVALDPALVFAALLRHEDSDRAAVAADVVAAGVAAAASAVGPTAPPVPVPTHFTPAPPEPYTVPEAPLVSSAELVLASTRAAAAVAAEGDPVAQPGSTFLPPAPEPYVVPDSPPITSAEWVLAATRNAAQAPPPAAEGPDTEATALGDYNDSIRKGFLEVLIP